MFAEVTGNVPFSHFRIYMWIKLMPMLIFVSFHAIVDKFMYLSVFLHYNKYCKVYVIKLNLSTIWKNCSDGAINFGTINYFKLWL